MANEASGADGRAAVRLRLTLELLRDERSGAKRKGLFDAAVGHLGDLLAERGPVTAEAIRAEGYKDGALATLSIFKDVRSRHERPLRTADVGTAGTVLNGVMNYGQFLGSEFESETQKHLCAHLFGDRS